MGVGWGQGDKGYLSFAQKDREVVQLSRVTQHERGLKASPGFPFSSWCLRPEGTMLAVDLGSGAGIPERGGLSLSLHGV